MCSAYFHSPFLPFTQDNLFSHSLISVSFLLSSPFPAKLQTRFFFYIAPFDFKATEML